MEKNIKIRRRHLKGEVKGFLAAMFLVWLVVGGVILSKVLAPSINMLLLQDNHVYTQHYGNPSNWEAKDEAYLSYNEYANTLVNMNKLVKAVVIIICFAPFIVTAFCVYNAVDKFVAKQIKRIKRQKHLAVRG